MSDAFVRAVLSGLPEDRQTPLIANWTRNRGVICDCHPRIHTALDELGEAPGIRAMAAGDALQFHAVAADGSSHLLTGTAQARTRAEALRVQRQDQFYLLAGAGLGPELRALFELTHQPEPMLPNWRIGIYVVEPELAHLALIFLLDDWAEVLRDDRVRWFVGDTALMDYAEFLFSSDQVVAAKKMYPLSFSQGRNELISGIQAIDSQSAQCHREQLPLASQVLAEYYETEGPRHMQAALAGETPLRVLGLTSRFTSFLQYCMRDLLWGFEQLGAETWLFIEPSDIHRPHSLAIAHAVEHCRPDLVVVIDHYRAEFPYLPETLPYVNWIQDLLPGIMDPSWERLLPNESVYVFSEGFKRTLSRRPKYEGMDLPVLPMGCNPELYRPLKQSDASLFDLAFVTHLVDPALTFEPFCQGSAVPSLSEVESALIEEEEYSAADLIRLYRSLGREMRAIPLDQIDHLFDGGDRLLNLFERARSASGVSVTDALHEYFKRTDSRFTRDILFQVKVRPAQALVAAGIDIRCYGRNWELVSQLSRLAQGEVENGEALNAVMNSASICLHCTGTGYHMRSVEIMAAGRFMLCRESDGDLMPITDLFEAGSEVVTFRTEEELVALTQRYLADPEARQRIATRARERLLEDYSYASIAERIVNDVARCRGATDSTVGCAQEMPREKLG